MVTKTMHIAKARRGLSKCLTEYESALKINNKANRNVERARARYLTLSHLTSGAQNKKRILDKALQQAQAERKVTDKRVMQCLAKLTEAQRQVDSMR
jgi:3-deoxy-D-manno-octulosonate 8-phosphate phosphatase KdsC-like HAD superfamily phosphatase